MTPSLIVGAGLTGLIAAHAWPQARVIDSMPEPRANHRALLRFRTDAVARMTGATFRKVRVRKGIWSEGRFVQPNIRVANQYAAKVLPGSLLGDRSIWNIDPVERYVAPEEFHQQLVDSVGGRIEWGSNFKEMPEWVFAEAKNPVVSTIPLPAMLSEDGVNDFASPDWEWNRAPIHVARYKVRGADLYQTIYFADPDNPIYRASMTGDILIVESTTPYLAEFLVTVFAAFHLGLQRITPIDNVEQRYGKIAPIDEARRRELLFKLTHEYQIYSLGRFATWRNILLDDVVNDIDVIKRLMRGGDSYELRRSS